jgi:hypothetical protein
MDTYACYLTMPFQRLHSQTTHTHKTHTRAGATPADRPSRCRRVECEAVGPPSEMQQLATERLCACRRAHEASQRALRTGLPPLMSPQLSLPPRNPPVSRGLRSDPPAARGSFGKELAVLTLPRTPMQRLRPRSGECLIEGTRRWSAACPLGRCAGGGSSPTGRALHVIGRPFPSSCRLSCAPGMRLLRCSAAPRTTGLGYPDAWGLLLALEPATCAAGSSRPCPSSQWLPTTARP